MLLPETMTPWNLLHRFFFFLLFALSIVLSHKLSKGK
jgi:hypothetical protein